MTLEQELRKAEPTDAEASFQFKSPELTTLRGFMKERREGREQRETEQPSYAVPLDDDVRRALSFVPLRLPLDELLEKSLQVHLGPIIHGGIRVSPHQFPEIYRVVDRCANRLGIAVPRVIITPDVRISAGTFGTSENHFILITSAMVEKCGENELEFLIGHECGHIHCRHLTYLALARSLTQFTGQLLGPVLGQLALPIQSLLNAVLQVPLAAWQRKAELTCDRAGLLCSRDLVSSLRAIAKNTVQASALAERMDLDEYLRQLESAEKESTLSKLPEYLTAFPLAPKRMMALKLFAGSEMYYDLIHQDGPPDLLSRDDLEKRIDRVTSIL